MKEKKVGRPTKYSSELGKEIYLAIATSTHGLNKLCELNPHWPNRTTILDWRLNKKEFSDMYARAKQQQVEAIVDEILAIADDASKDFIVDEEGKLVVNFEHIQRAKLRIDTRKWLAGKLAPRVYGDKVEVNTTASLNENIQTVQKLTEEYLQKDSARIN